MRPILVILSIVTAGGLVGWLEDELTGRIISTVVSDVIVPAIDQSAAEIAPDAPHRPSILGTLSITRMLIGLAAYEIPGVATIGAAYGAAKRLGI